MPDVSVTNLPSVKDDSKGPASSEVGADAKTMSDAMSKVKSNAADMARTTAGKMMGGNTVISINSMKGEALRGRNDNAASKKQFKTQFYARTQE